MIFLGTLFPENREKELISNSRAGISNAGNSFQWKMIRGIRENTDDPLTIINVLPVGTWPKHYKIFHLRDHLWTYADEVCHEIGSINIPLLKQVIRTIKIRKLLKQYKNETEIVVFTPYLPFLCACSVLPRKQKVTMVVTDIPEFYDMHQVSALRKFIRKVHNKIVYHYMKRVNRFILLTEDMKDPLHVGSRPYIVMEGICDSLMPVRHKEDQEIFALLYTGRLNRRYGLNNLLDAIERLDDPDIELWLCGSGEMESEIRERSQKDHRIKFFGYVSHEESLSLQQKASVLVNPRTNDGEYTKYSFPSKTMEYMAAGKPVMMYRLDGIPAEYDPYLFYIPEETTDSICDTIIKLKKMGSENRKQIANAAREFVISKKNRTTQMHRILSFIKGAGEGR